MSEQIDYEAVLADLRAKRDKLDAAIAGIETMLGVRGLAGAEPGQPAGAELGPGAFLGMTIVDATIKYLRATRKNQRTEDILIALKQGGLAFSSGNPINTVGSVLARNWESKGDIVRVERGVWGLGEWHPRLRKKVLRPSNGTELNELVDEAVEDVAANLNVTSSSNEPAQP